MERAQEGQRLVGRGLLCQPGGFSHLYVFSYPQNQSLPFFLESFRPVLFRSLQGSQSGQRLEAWVGSHQGGMWVGPSW